MASRRVLISRLITSSSRRRGEANLSLSPCERYPPTRICSPSQKLQSRRPSESWATLPRSDSSHGTRNPRPRAGLGRPRDLRSIETCLRRGRTWNRDVLRGTRSRCSGGRGIRTRERVAPLHALQACPFVRSGRPPRRFYGSAPAEPDGTPVRRTSGLLWRRRRDSNTRGAD